MLLLHETHQVDGRHERDFEARIREEWMPALAASDDARLLYFLHHAVGTGASYRVVTISALRDGAAWETLARRIHEGDLRALARGIDDVRHEVVGKLLAPLPWSPLRELDLAAVPTEPQDHELSLFMEDTVWPYEGRLDDYIEAAGAHYAKEIAERNAEGRSLITLEAGFRTAFGSGRRREIVLWQKIHDRRALGGLIAHEVPERYKRPGLWMHDALALRDRWESRLLRTSRWSPCW